MLIFFFLLEKDLISAPLNCSYVFIINPFVCYVVNCLHDQIPIHLLLLPHLLVDYLRVCIICPNTSRKLVLSSEVGYSKVYGKTSMCLPSV